MLRPGFLLHRVAVCQHNRHFHGFAVANNIQHDGLSGIHFMQRVGQAFGALRFFPGELHDHIVRMQPGFSRGRIVVHGGNSDPFIRSAS